jgi:hypothetical protein
VLLLVRHGRKEQALEFLNKAAGNNPDLLLARAMVLALMDRAAPAVQALKEIEAQWPEWDQPYVVHGLLLERTQPNATGRPGRGPPGVISRRNPLCVPRRHLRAVVSEMSAVSPVYRASSAGGPFT